MQPAVTDVQISVSASNNITVNVVPKERLPPIFIGECLIVYAILHDKSPSSSPQEGKILLTGDLLGAKVEHKMKFPIKPAVKKETASQVSTIHHLAAKKLIKELELDGEKKAEIIQLSCDSNVISSQTAFIAIDQDRKQAVKGSLHSWDLIPREEEEFMLMRHPMTFYSGHQKSLACSYDIQHVSTRCRSSSPEPASRCRSVERSSDIHLESYRSAPMSFRSAPKCQSLSPGRTSTKRCKSVNAGQSLEEANNFFGGESKTWFSIC